MLRRAWGSAGGAISQGVRPRSPPQPPGEDGLFLAGLRP